MLTVIIILFVVWIVYMGAGQAGKAQWARKRAIETEINSLSAEKQKLAAMIIRAEEYLAQELEENRARVREESEKSKQSLAEEIDRVRKQKLAEVEKEADADKIETVRNLNNWVEQEKSRLKERLDEEYERKLEELNKLNR